MALIFIANRYTEYARSGTDYPRQDTAGGDFRLRFYLYYDDAQNISGRQTRIQCDYYHEVGGGSWTHASSGQGVCYTNARINGGNNTIQIPGGSFSNGNRYLFSRDWYITHGTDGVGSFTFQGILSGWYSRTTTGVTTYSLPTMYPSAPSAPSGAYVPSSTPPDRTVYVSWNASSGGTNGVSGYQLAWNKGTGWNYIDVGNTTGYSLNLNSLGFGHGSVLSIAVQSYSTVWGNKYYSGWTYSSSTTTLFVAPSYPRTVLLNHNTTEPIPTTTFTGSWLAPSSGGSNGIGGYRFRIWKNDAEVYIIDTDTAELSRTFNATTYNLQPGDRVRIGLYSYTYGQGNKYFNGGGSGEAQVFSAYVTMVSDKHIYLSIDGEPLTKRKMYISENGSSFTEVKKEKLKIL